MAEEMTTTRQGKTKKSCQTKNYVPTDTHARPILGDAVTRDKKKVKSGSYHAGLIQIWVRDADYRMLMSEKAAVCDKSLAQTVERILSVYYTDERIADIMSAFKTLKESRG